MTHAKLHTSYLTATKFLSQAKVLNQIHQMKPSSAFLDRWLSLSKAGRNRVAAAVHVHKKAPG
jgi:hypothetical protein